MVDDRQSGPFGLRFGTWICGGIMPYALKIDSTGTSSLVTVRIYPAMEAVHRANPEDITLEDSRELLDDERFVIRDGIHPETVADLALEALTKVI